VRAFSVIAVANRLTIFYKKILIQHACDLIDWIYCRYQI
jgi:hypothetical protein